MVVKAKGSKKKMQIVMTKIEDITPYPGNTKIHQFSVPAIKKSIQEFGFVNPIVVDKDGVIIMGHGRRMASIELGYSEVPVLEASHLTGEQVMALRLADNRISENSTWDNEALAQELSILSDAGYDVDVTGFSEEEVTNILEEYSSDDVSGLLNDETPGDAEKEKSQVKADDRVAFMFGEYKGIVDADRYLAWEKKLVAKTGKGTVEVMSEIFKRLGM